ncbi:MAG: PBP1A family penicillin-binding protein [Myxococcota bacterium]
MNESKREFKVAGVRIGRLHWLVRIALFLVVAGIVVGGVAAASIYAIYAPTVPTFKRVEDYQPKIGTRIYSADNQLIGEFAAERRVLVAYADVPERLYNAFIAAEDKRFWSHGGVDVIGVAQAIFDKLRKPSSKLRGASTITQQVAKSLLAEKESYEAATERSLERKIREAILARRLESNLSKEGILYLYVNQVFLGHKAYGVQAAAEHYFRKNVWELSLAEAATLAGLPQRPSDYSPFSRPEKAYARRKYVLRRMLEEGFVSQEDHDAAVAEEITVYPRNELYLRRAPYYTEQVRREFIERYGERALLEEGFEVYTAVNLEEQHHAQNALMNGLYALDRRQGYRGAFAKLESKAMRTRFDAAYRKHLEVEGDKPVELKKGREYLGVVESVYREHAIVDVLGNKATLPLAGMRWARKPDPTERIDYHYLEDVRGALKKRDIVVVKLTSRDALKKSPHGWAAVRVIPKDAKLLLRLEQVPAAQAAIMSADATTGYVTAQVGGFNFEDSTFNRAVQACREPGSSFKPFVYSAAIDKLDYTASTMIDDKPLVFDDPDNEVRWKPGNAESSFRGELPLRTALQDSINTPAIRVAEAVGIDDIITNARRMGITAPLKRELGTALGSSCVTLFDMTTAYTALNRYGKRRDLKFIRRVVDRYGNVIEDHSAPSDPTVELGSRIDRGYQEFVAPTRQAMERQTAFLTISLLQNVVQGGTGMRARKLGVPIAGKTGTTNDAYDAWFMAFTRKRVTGVWVGHDKKERPLGVNEQGGRTAAPVWVSYMDKVLTDFSKKPPRRINHGYFPTPSGVVRVSIDPETGLLARPGGRSVSEYYRKGSEPTEYTPDARFAQPDSATIFDVDM